MIKAYPIRPEKSAKSPAATHVDGTGRLQSVSKDVNPSYWRLIKALENQTGLPIVFSMSSSENEPIVNPPRRSIASWGRRWTGLCCIGSSSSGTQHDEKGLVITPRAHAELQERGLKSNADPSRRCRHRFDRRSQ